MFRTPIVKGNKYVQKIKTNYIGNVTQNDVLTNLVLILFMKTPFYKKIIVSGKYFCFSLLISDSLKAHLVTHVLVHKTWLEF